MKTSGITIEQFETKLSGLINDILPEVFVISDGVNVADIVLHEEVAKHICSRMNSKTDNVWMYGDISSVIKYAFKAGYETGRRDEQDKKLRSSDVQQEQE